MALEKFNITLAQVEQTDIPTQNLEIMVDVIDQVRTDLLIFPETQLSGLSKGDIWEYRKVLQGRAKKSNLWLAYGSYVELLAAHGIAIENKVELLDRRGNLQHIYGKEHLWNEPGVDAGEPGRVAQTELGNIGFVICWDLAHPEAVRKLAAQGADLVICPSYWFGDQYGTTQVIDNLPLVRAFENQVYMAYCDAYTADGSTAARSKICSPLQVLAAAEPQKRQIVSTDINLSELAEIRATFDCYPRKDTK